MLNAYHPKHVERGKNNLLFLVISCEPNFSQSHISCCGGLILTFKFRN
jgi:hypothetical protein